MRRIIDAVCAIVGLLCELPRVAVWSLAAWWVDEDREARDVGRDAKGY